MSKRKYQNMDTSSGALKFQHKRPAAPEQTKIIIDLNDDCLVNIFERLTLRSLFNVGVACNWLIPAASTVYRRKFSRKIVCINYDEYYGSPFISGPHCDFIGNQIKVHGFLQCMQYLRFFGASISNLKIWSRQWTTEQCHRIYRYANKYGADSLINIEFNGKPSIPIGRFEKPFAGVQTVSIFGHDLNEEFPTFPQHFPSVRTLKLTYVRASKRCIETPFQHLSELHIEINADDFHRFTDADVAALLAMCRQLQSLYIYVFDLRGMALNSVLNFVQGNPLLRKLNVLMTQYTMAVLPSEIVRLTQEHPTLGELNLRGYEFTADQAIAVLQQIGSLTKFSFKIDNQAEYEYFARELNKFQAISCFCSTTFIVIVEKN